MEAMTQPRAGQTGVRRETPGTRFDLAGFAEFYGK